MGAPHKHYIYIIYYYTANGINLWSIEFTIKYMTVITEALSSNKVTTQLYRHGIRITNQTKKRIPTFKIENSSPNINVYLFLGVDIFKTVRSRNGPRYRTGGAHGGSISVVVIKYA